MSSGGTPPDKNVNDYLAQLEAARAEIISLRREVERHERWLRGEEAYPHGILNRMERLEERLLELRERATELQIEAREYRRSNRWIIPAVIGSSIVATLAFLTNIVQSVLGGG